MLAGRGPSRHARRRPTMRDDWRGRGRRNLSCRRPSHPRRPDRRSRRARPPDAPGGDPSRPPPRPSRSTPSKPPLNNIPGAWCSLTARAGDLARWAQMSQCTYRCVVLPDRATSCTTAASSGPSQCTYRCVVLPDTVIDDIVEYYRKRSQCTYRCVVLPDQSPRGIGRRAVMVSMHLQVRGAP